MSDTKKQNKRVRKRTRRRIKWNRVALLALIVLLIISAVVVAVVTTHSKRSPNSSVEGDSSSVEGGALFGIKTITVEGCSHYTQDDILEASDLKIGQSVFSVNKKQAGEKILAACPYVDTVTIKSSSFNGLTISIAEATPVGVIPMEDGSYIVLGDNAKGLEKLPADSDRLPGYMVIRTAVVEGRDVGHLMLEDRNRNILDTLFAAFTGYGLENITSIDLTEYTDIRLIWKDQITIKLGNDSDLDPEIRSLVAALDRILKSNGSDARGQIDMSSYSDTNPSNDEIVYTPDFLLNTTTTAAPSP